MEEHLSWRAATGLPRQPHPARRLLVWQRVIREADWPRSGVIVAEAQRPIIGSLTSPTRDSDSELAAVGELTFIYVLPSWWGQGIGRN